MKKLLACLLLALPLAVNAEEYATLRDYYIQDDSTYRMFCFPSKGRCYHTQYFFSWHSVVAEISVDGEIFIAWSAACSSEDDCRKRMLSARENLRNILIQYFPSVRDETNHDADKIDPFA